MKFLLSLFIVTCLCSSSLFAQSETAETTPGQWRYGATLGVDNLDSDVANAELIESDAISIGFSADYRKNTWVTSLGMSFISYDDHAEFSQLVVGEGLFNNGDISNESSDASAVLAEVAFGYEWLYREQNDVSLTLQAGYGHLFASERAISNCSDCYSESIDVDAGVFAKVSLMKDQDRFSWGAYLKQYLTGDGLSNSLGLVMTTRY